VSNWIQFIKARNIRVITTESDATYQSRNFLVRRYFWSRLRGMVQMVEQCDARVVLDLGCGRGELLLALARKFPGSECVGIDIARDPAILREPNLNRQPNEQLLRADCNHLPLRPNSSQLILCASLLEHLPSVELAVSEIQRVLESEGTLVVGVPTENRFYGIARKLARLRKPSDHFHKSGYLESILEQKFVRSRARKLPFSFLPDFLSLYHILVFGEHF
jgi:ubiquinone/menaquinone biosynthesis C-methylase UbiE